jgi:hypothetical protein
MSVLFTILHALYFFPFLIYTAQKLEPEARYKLQISDNSSRL